MSNKKLKIFAKLDENLRTVSNLKSLDSIVWDLKSNSHVHALISEIRNESDPTSKKKLKLGLPALLVSASANFSGSRNKKNIRVVNLKNYHTGFIQIDIDHVDSSRIAAMKEKLSGEPGAVLTFISPSGDGIKCILRVFDFNQIRRDRKCNLKSASAYAAGLHNKVFNAVTKSLAASGYPVDTSVSNINRAMFLSNDPDVITNFDSTDVYPWKLAGKQAGSHYSEKDVQRSSEELEGLIQAQVARIKDATNRNSTCFSVGARIAELVGDQEIDMAALQKTIESAIDLVSEDTAERAEFRTAINRGIQRGNQSDSESGGTETMEEGTVDDPYDFDAQNVDAKDFFDTEYDQPALCILPTGAGKSYNAQKKAVEIARAGEKVLLLVQNKNAIQETVDALADVWGYKNADVCMEAKSKPVDGAKLVVSHYFYLQHRGHSDFTYELMGWIDSDTTVIIDEIDACLTAMQLDIPLSLRLYNNKPQHTCPNKSSNDFRCMDCHLAMPTPNWDINDTVPTIDVPYPNKSNPNPIQLRFDIMNTGAFTAPVSLHKTAKMDIRSSSYGYTPIPIVLKPGVPDTDDFNLWVKNLVSCSTYARVVEPAPDSPKQWIDTYEKKREEYTAERAQVYGVAYASETERKNKIKSFEAKVTKAAKKAVQEAIASKTIPNYPHYPCGMKTLQIGDGGMLTHISGVAERVVLLTATLSAADRNLLQQAIPGLQIFRGSGGRKTTEELTILCTPKPINYENIRETQEKDLLFYPTKGNMKQRQDKARREHSEEVFWHAEHGFTHYYRGDSTKPQLHTYSRSAISRGSNFPEYEAAWVSYGSYKPSMHYHVQSGQTFQDAVNEELVSLVLQQCGRILRTGPDGSISARKTLVIHGCVGLDETDISKAVGELIRQKNLNMAGKIKAIAFPEGATITDAHHDRACQLVRGGLDLPTAIGEALDDEFYINHKTFSEIKSMKNSLSNVMPENYFLTRRYTLILETYKTEFSGKSPAERRRACHWSRLKQNLPGSVYQDYEDFFEEDKK